MLKALMVFVFTAAGAVLGSVLTTEPAGQPAPAAPAVAANAPADAEYVGAAACKKCHFKQHKTWTSMKHANAWEVLDEKYHDPSEKDEHGRACISCHVTGWGEPGGFVDAATSEHLLGVQCEACHGAGSQHVELGQTMLKEKRKELAAGEEWHVVRRTAKCADCHNPHLQHSKD